jgi:hypothetical protein
MPFLWGRRFGISFLLWICIALCNICELANPYHETAKNMGQEFQFLFLQMKKLKLRNISKATDLETSKKDPGVQIQASQCFSHHTPVLSGEITRLELTRPECSFQSAINMQDKTAK